MFLKNTLTLCTTPLQILYEKAFASNKAYELWIKWFIANSQKVSELVRKQWQRNAQKLQLHVFPVPEDAFAEPTNFLSSPLRCPIFVPLNAALFPPGRLQDAVPALLCTFGFQLMNCPLHRDRERLRNIYGNDTEPTVQYVHRSGGMFVKLDAGTNKFMWAWNHMLSHRYRAK